MTADHDRTFVRTFLAVLGVLLGITFAIIFASRWIMASATPDEPSEARVQRIEERTRPVFEVVTDPDKVQKVAVGGSQDEGGDAGGEAQSPEQVYKQVCASCHDAGVAGAPQLTDSGAWKPRLEKGKETLYEHAINGFNMMPPKGGNAGLSDKAVEGAVDYMVEQAGG